MAKKITYERWINLYLPDGWSEREEMGFIFLEKENWPGMLQLSFIEREETTTPSDKAALVMLEDTLEERDIPFPREAVKVETSGTVGIASVDYAYKEKEEPIHWRIWFLVDKTRSLMAAYVCDPKLDDPALTEASRIIADIEFL
ncbi:MAG: hypothetical protein A2X56_13295 [Nitrospirae bacterium GWC2_57_13]|jgi:hypothetical protein|nr:MAG: hypothetical protein A2072_05880 [Nitrospirae bacterium GWC1_57_7]OGW26996.1 MAG: hypothetical protein A2X56_13295 [Nitrospirae bacterium GWC2_57_13]HAR44618.1 hypothetical protein [Nitrospiraceae bacterium]HAS52808.1 hypothetical protein [Nitrospiraceae bacterium]